MKIAIYSPHFAGIRGGCERDTANFANTFCHMGHECSIYYQARGKMEPKYHVDEAVKLVPMSPDGNQEALKHHAAQLDCLIINYGGVATMPMLRLFNNLGAPLLAREVISPEGFQLSGCSLDDRVGFLSGMDKIVVQCVAYLDSLPDFLRSRAVSISNPVDGLHEIDWNREQKKRKTILCVTRLDERQKSISMLIKAFVQLAGEFPDWDLKICGEGPYRRDYENLITENNLIGRVFLPGMVEDVDAEYSQANTFCLPSIFEGLPNALLEAQSHGLPSVGFASCDGVNEIIVHGENGFLAPVRTPESLAETLRPLMADAELRREMALGSHRLAKRYDKDEIYGRWEKIVEETAALKGHTRLHIPSMSEEDLAAHRLALLYSGETEKARMRKHIASCLPRIRRNLLSSKVSGKRPF